MDIEAAVRFFDRQTDQIEDAETTRDRLAHAIAGLGFEFFEVSCRQGASSAGSAAGSGTVLAARWPDGWPEVYAARKYATIDPANRYLGHARSGFRLSEAAAAYREDPQFKRMQRMMNEARSFGIEDRYVFPVHSRRGLVGALSVGGSSVNLAPAELVVMEAFAKHAFWTLIEAVEPAVFERLSQPVTMQLTNREMQTLEYLVTGMTSNQIGATLGLSAHTVDWYMNGIQEKLHARNRHHVVAIAFRLGLIS